MIDFKCITAWHFCGVAMSSEVEQKTLARPQEMLVITQTYSNSILYLIIPGNGSLNPA